MKQFAEDARLHLSRRELLKLTTFAAAGLTLPTWLTACGGDGTTTTQVAPLTVDPAHPWWLQNGFEPVTEEVEAFDLPVRGGIPPQLSGLYVRNGSNPQRANSPHWFFGDGMIHGVRIENGKALWYRNRYVRTPLYLGDLSFGQGGPPVGGNNQSNVSAIYHAGRLLTSGEIGFPYEIDQDDLSTIGPLGFDGKLNTSFTAHPKIDPATGNLHFFGYWLVPPFLTYHVADPQGRIVHSQQIDVDASTMMHSFAITESDVVFWECPVVFDLQAALSGELNPFKWTPSYGARIGVMPLGGLGSQIRWVEIDPCYVYHEVNAYRDGDEVVIHVCRLDSTFTDHDVTTPLKHHRWRVNTAGEQLTFSDEIVTGRRMDMPSHDRRFTGRPHRYGWLVDLRPNDETVDFGGIARLDYRSGQIGIWQPGPARHSNEPFFVAEGSGEGEGWLLSYVYDRSNHTSDLVILDAENVEKGPVAEIRLPQRVPHGFHGVWVSA